MRWARTDTIAEPGNFPPVTDTYSEMKKSFDEQVEEMGEEDPYIQDPLDCLPVGKLRRPNTPREEQRLVFATLVQADSAPVPYDVAFFATALADKYSMAKKSCLELGREFVPHVEVVDLRAIDWGEGWIKGNDFDAGDAGELYEKVKLVFAGLLSQLEGSRRSYNSKYGRTGKPDIADHDLW